MKKLLACEWQIFVLSAILLLFYCLGLKLVPFHPDEATQIFMSQDFNIFLANPQSLTMPPSGIQSPEMSYRALDAPLTRYFIGLSRVLFNLPALGADWDWSASWQENAAQGAYPAQDLLLASRFFPVLCTTAALVFFYFSARNFLPRSLALLSVLYLGLHPLILLHARRAMAEPALLLGICLLMWSISRAEIQPLAVGTALAVALNAKQSAALLLPAAIIAVCLSPDGRRSLKDLLIRPAVMLIPVGVITFLLNPFYWRAPFQALSNSMHARRLLTQAQVIDHLGGSSLNLLNRLVLLISNLFTSPLSFLDHPQYSQDIQLLVIDYNALLPHTWGRGMIPGAIQLAVAAAGLYVCVRRYHQQPHSRRQRLLLFALATLILVAGILFTLPIPWQRYVIPLLPFIAFWSGYGLLPLAECVQELLNRL